MPSLSLEALRALALKAGLSVVGVTGGEALSLDRERLAEWQSRGFAAGMAYMLRPAELLSSPARIEPEACSVISVAVFYDRRPRAPLAPGHGRVARYAWGRDYHKVLRKRLEQLVGLVQAEVGERFPYRVFSDSVPLLERAMAVRAGVGFVGKNTMVIIPKRGSFSFLGEILWGVSVDGGAPPARAAGRCGSCSRCLTGCPTGAFVSERVMDAGRCISYLTIEKRGWLLPEERQMLGAWIFGCDVCQDVCPFNAAPLRRAQEAEVPELGPAFGVGESLSLAEVLALRDESAFLSRFGGTALMRARREGLLRNAAVVAANTGAAELISALSGVSAEDSSPVVRGHALWACAALVEREGAPRAPLRQRLSAALRDPCGEVVREAEELLSRLPN